MGLAQEFRVLTWHDMIFGMRHEAQHKTRLIADTGDVIN